MSCCDDPAASDATDGRGPRGSGPPRGRSGPPRPPEIDPARLAALELLTAVRVRDAYANLAMPAILRRHRLRDRDAALATELGYGTLRARGLLDAVIDECTDRPLARVEPTLLDALRLGAYQLLRTRVPPHAAVDTTVELVRVEAGSRAAGFVNAVLRRVGERDEKAWVQQLAPDAIEDPLGHTAFAHAHPRWIAQAFADALGADAPAELDDALAADDARPVVHLLARPGEITAEELALVTGGTEAPYSPYGVHLEPGGGDIGELDAVAEGLATVQDEGSQLVALALTRAPVLGADTGRWLDLCAGPGGKSVLLGSLLALDGGRLDAVEQSEHRADLVRRATDGLPVTSTPPTAGRPRCPTPPTTGCSWTPRAPASARCDGGRKPWQRTCDRRWDACPSRRRLARLGEALRIKIECFVSDQASGFRLASCTLRDIAVQESRPFSQPAVPPETSRTGLPPAVRWLPPPRRTLIPARRRELR